MEMAVQFPPIPRRRMAPMTPPREYRLRSCVPLVRAAVFADLSPARASLIERYPDRARPGELDRLRSGVDRATRENSACKPTEDEVRLPPGYADQVRVLQAENTQLRAALEEARICVNACEKDHTDGLLKTMNRLLGREGG